MPPRRSVSHAILQVIGPNEVDILEKMTVFISEYGGRIVQDIATVFGTEFVAFFLVAGDAADLALMGKQLPRLEREFGFTFRLTPTRDSAAAANHAELMTIRIQCAHIKPLLKSITAVFVKHEVELIFHQGREYRPQFAGAPVEYLQIFTLRRPPDMDQKRFDKDLRFLSEQLGFLYRPEEPVSFMPR